MRLAAATAIVIAITAATGCGGGAAHHSRYLDMQKCASCHGISADAKRPLRVQRHQPVDPANRPQLEQVRRAIIDGRPGMPKAAGRSDVDQIAAYLSGETK